MKYIWEPKDFDKESSNWGLMATNHDELIIIGGLRATSLRDGHSWEYDSPEEMAEEFNRHIYEPVLAPINPSVILKQAAKKKFNYGAGLDA